MLSKLQILMCLWLIILGYLVLMIAQNTMHHPDLVAALGICIAIQIMGSVLFLKVKLVKIRLLEYAGILLFFMPTIFLPAFVPAIVTSNFSFAFWHMFN